MSTWIVFTLMAALMQSVRTAGQKQLSKQLSAMATTLVRFLFALPFAWIYFFSVSHYQQPIAFSIDQNFIWLATWASLAQIAASVCLILAFRYQNLSVATSLA